jgi:hypothetical protein
MRRNLITFKNAMVVILLSFGSLPTGQAAQQSSTLAGGSPGMNYSRELLKRKDVQNELGLDATQKEILAHLLNQSPGQIAARAVRDMPPVKYQDISKLSNEERKQWQAEIGRRAAAQAVNQMNEQRREVEEVLRPDQRQRLSELDLQWRGILALGNKSLSDRLGVSPAHHQRIAEILADFEVKRLRLLSYSEKSEDSDSPLYQKRRVLLQETEQKVLALLSDEEKARWLQAIGQPFKFGG